MNIYTTKIKNKKRIKSTGFRIQKHIEDSNLPLDSIKPVTNSTVAVFKNDIFSLQLPDKVTIFTSEARAIDLKLWNIPYNELEVLPRTFL